ncbi:hypothetical protein [Endozoicomonas elysicola]|uniref:Uncharacterized protein n=1 Tax=Endozoicomonas elysicola TaxID=305900 RepID=A0A081KEF7_9GAMM|nr:hypothetical protein [Endozoicomonas elysicola]KEI72533.1 hypothetical protein GV64_18965 [Endozoicomonas elysicola]
MKLIPTTVLALALSSITAAQAGLMGPRPPVNLSMGLDGAAAMHSDSAASDTTYLSGPGAEGFKTEFAFLNGVCSTVLVRRDGNPLVVCSDFGDQSPMIYLLDQNTSAVMAQMRVELGSTMGGIYAYLDYSDRVVIADGADALLWVEAKQKDGQWSLKKKKRVNLSRAVPKEEYINALNPDAEGGVWFVTDQAMVGRYDPEEKETVNLRLGKGETVHNSFANSGDGKAAIATDRALYLLEYDDDEIEVVWREEYEAGSHRKPGKLSHGTGSSPTFFGPVSGTEFLTIADNADDGEQLLIFDTEVKGKRDPLVCEVNLPVAEGVFASENSPIGLGRTAIVSSTYGYPYPIDDTLPPSVPSSAPMVGGMFRVDVSEGYKPGKGVKESDPSVCSIVWENPVHSSAVPKLSVSDQLIYTVDRQGDDYSFMAIDFHTGETLDAQLMGSGRIFNTLQLAGNAGFRQTYWQGTTGGVIKVSRN